MCVCIYIYMYVGLYMWYVRIDVCTLHVGLLAYYVGLYYFVCETVVWRVRIKGRSYGQC